jgi:hypothetical protein
MDCRDTKCRAHGRYLRRIARLQRTLVRERKESRDHQRRLAAAWSAYIDLLIDARLDDGTPVLTVVLARNPRLREELDRLLRGTT